MGRGVRREWGGGEEKSRSKRRKGEIIVMKFPD